ncbi:nitroreductase family protein [Vibrio cyclitrophicus]|nr:nitroreductase family protein [Vibrio cyclitrophicus]UPR47535.1 nitroreductase family protein [Vibrio cyclitrophicus]
MSSLKKEKLKKISHKLLGQGGFSRLITRLIKVRGHFSSLFAFSRLTARIYYSIFDSSFITEQIKILKGIKRFNHSVDNYSLLRRNTHKLEKGMTMIPRRSSFAADYIVETVCIYKSIIDSKKNEYNLNWTESILDEYFSLVSKENDFIQKAFEIYSNIERKEYAEKKVPLIRSSVPPLDFEDLLVACKFRKSVRWYKDKPVEKYKIEQAISLAMTAPSACNRQPFKFYYTDNHEVVLKVSNLAMGTSGFRDNIQGLFIVVGDTSYFNMAHDRHVIYIDSSLASMQLMLALDSLGLASCPINWPEIDRNNEKISKILGLSDTERTVMLISTGYERSGVKVPYSDKKEVAEVLKVVE